MTDNQFGPAKQWQEQVRSKAGGCTGQGRTSRVLWPWLVARVALTNVENYFDIS